MARCVLDTFALYAYFMGEPAATEVGDLLRRAESGTDELSVPAFNLGELVYKLWRKSGPGGASDALQVIDHLPIEIVDADRALILRAASIKAERRMGYLDCFPAALAERREASIATGDSGFVAVEDLVPIYWLPRP